MKLKSLEYFDKMIILDKINEKGNMVYKFNQLKYDNKLGGEVK